MMGGMMSAAVQPRADTVTDFREYSTGADLSTSDWSHQWGSTNLSVEPANDSSSLSGRRITIDKTVSSATRCITWDRVGTITDAQFLGRFKYADVLPADRGYGQINMRISGGSGSEDSYFFTINRNGGVKGITVNTLVNNVATAIDADAFTYDHTNWWWVRMETVGTTIRVKIWQDGTSEPSSWTLSGTNATYSSGHVGLGMFWEPFNYYCDWFAVAEGGKTAPSPSG